MIQRERGCIQISQTGPVLNHWRLVELSRQRGPHTMADGYHLSDEAAPKCLKRTPFNKQDPPVPPHTYPIPTPPGLLCPLPWYHVHTGGKWPFLKMNGHSVNVHLHTGCGGALDVSGSPKGWTGIRPPHAGSQDFGQKSLSPQHRPTLSFGVTERFVRGWDPS